MKKQYMKKIFLLSALLPPAPHYPLPIPEEFLLIKTTTEFGRKEKRH